MSQQNPASFRTLYLEAFRQLEKYRQIPEVEVRFYPYAGLHHTIRLRSGRVYVRISDIFKTAPLNVQRALAYILVARLLRKPTPANYELVYKEYTTSAEVLRASDIARRRRGRKIISTARGTFYDLNKIFARLNRSFFDNQLKKPVLTWSQRRTHRILGHHDSVHETIVISKTLDSKDVPEWFVEYILYHEMLHVKHPAKLINGRRYYHTNAFRMDEERFPYYFEAQKWLDGFAQQKRYARARAA